MVLGDSLLEEALTNLEKIALENGKEAEKELLREQEYKTKARVAYDSLSNTARDLIEDSRAKIFFDNAEEIVLFDFPVRNSKKIGIGFVMRDKLQVIVGSESVREGREFYEAFRKYSGIDDDYGIKEFLDKINRKEILGRIASYSSE